MGGRTAWVLADQLSHRNPALEGADRVLLIESEAKLRSGRFHRQKLHLVLSAMRHFARELDERGVEVDHRRAGSLAAGLGAHVAQRHPAEVVLLEPTAARAGAVLGRLPKVRVLDGGLFLTSPADFAGWAQGRKRLVMEGFYRWQRRRLDILMDGDEPAGGAWNFDTANRRSPPRDRRPPKPYLPREDAIDEAVRHDLDRLALDTFGDDGPRLFPATRDQALRALDRFVEHLLPHFGPWQDAMVAGERWMWHSRLSSSLNLGLLDPLECARAAEQAYRDGVVPIESAEGFVRQLIGWREYVWGMYRLHPDLPARRGRALPPLFDGGPTRMRCLDDSLTGLRETGYAHHIERLMLYGNLMLLLGVSPRAAVDWFHHAFVDGYEWVMAPNVEGMALWADGGRMMTKPYAASGRYVDRMSTYCRDCEYSPGERTGDSACPYTTLYWDYLDRKREALSGNRRMQLSLRNLERIDGGELAEIRRRGARLRRRFTA